MTHFSWKLNCAQRLQHKWSQRPWAEIYCWKKDNAENKNFLVLKVTKQEVRWSNNGENRPWTEGETGSWVSSCCDIDWSRSPWRTAALYSFPGPNKYWNGFQPNTISNSAILSPSGSNTAGCNRQAERASPPSWINLLLSEAFEVMGSHLWSALSAEHMCHFFFLPIVSWRSRSVRL